MNKRLLFIATFALLAAPVLAGCAENGDDGGTTTTPGGNTTPGGTTPTGTTPATTPTIPTTPPKTVDLQLNLGIMVPLTGALNNLGPDMRDGALLAVEEINAADIGLHIETFVEDDKTTDSAAAPTTFQRLVGNGVTAVVGPCCSGVTGAVLEPAVQSEVVVASMSATSPALTLDRENDGYFWRIVPSDAVQGKVLAQLVDEDEVASVSMIIVNNAYGNGLANVFQETFEGLGGTVTSIERYNEGTQEFSSAVTAICGSNAEGLVFVAYTDDGANILRGMQSQGCLDQFKMYSAEGMFTGEGTAGLPEKAGQDDAGNWLAAGIRGTTPASPESDAGSSFKQRFAERWGHEPAQYAAESYDAVVYIALGVLAAESVEGADFRNQLLDVANGGTGKVSVTDVKQAMIAVLAGVPIDYDGAAHDFDFDENHEPGTGLYSVWLVGEDGNVSIVETGRSA